MSPVHPYAKNAQVMPASNSISNSAQKGNNNKVEGGWKKKVKTELCRFWLNGQECENSAKEQGCGFAHG